MVQKYTEGCLLKNRIPHKRSQKAQSKNLYLYEMKYAAFVLLVGLTFVACEKEEGLLSRKEKRSVGVPVVDWTDTFSTDSLYFKHTRAYGAVVSDSGLPVSERGFVYSLFKTPTLEDTKIKCGEGLGPFKAKINGLEYGQTYFVRAYAINETGVGYAEERQIEGFKLGLATVTANSTPINVRIDGTAQVRGEVVSENGGNVTDRGVVWSTGSNPTTQDFKQSSGSGLGVFAASLTGLKYNTQYHYRAYAVNEAGTAYSDDYVFDGYSLLVPTLTVNNTPSVIGISSITIDGGVSSANGGTVTERGIVWSKNPNPTTSNNKQSSGAGLGNFTVNLSGVDYNSKIYYRSYAINQAGTGYSPEYSFTSYSLNPATVSTGSTPTIQKGSAQITGSVLAGNGGTVSERGVVWSTSPNPTTSGNKRASGSGLGDFTVNLTVANNTKFYYRAYAINEAGTAYGTEYSFNSFECKAPSVTTYSGANYTYKWTNGSGDVYEVTIEGRVNSSGTEAIKSLNMWHTYDNPPTGSGFGVPMSNYNSATGDFYVTWLQVARPSFNPSGKWYFQASATNGCDAVGNGSVQSYTLP